MGELWLRLLRMTVIPLVVTQMFVAVLGAHGRGSIAALGGKALLAFVGLLVLAALFALGAAPPMVALFPTDALTVASLKSGMVVPEAARAASQGGHGSLGGWLSNLIPTNIFPATWSDPRPFPGRWSGAAAGPSSMGRAQFTRDALEEERAYVLGNPHQAQLREIFSAARVDYGRIDCAIKDGVIETWEINLNPTIGRGSRSPSGVIPPEMQQHRREAREHFYRRFQAAFETIDLAGPSIPISYRADTLDGPGPLCRPTHSTRRLESVRWVFRPFRLLLDPILKTFLPFLPLVARATIRKPPSSAP